MNQVEEESGNKLGTFAGVFTPSILSILGIIFFMRLGFVVGNAGLIKALVILVLANTISILTTLSLSAIATNMKVKGGGVYYLISRTLGIRFGGSIGIVLFLAQSISIAFYCIGFGEAVSGMFGQSSGYSVQFIAAGAITILFVFAWMGADWATRFQFVVMGLLIVSILMFFAGGILRFDTEIMSMNLSSPRYPVNFWFLFAIFFPAVTGFTQGVNMSGDLREPGKSLTRGTLMAVGISMVIYLLASIVFAGAAPRDILTQEYASMKRIALFGIFVDAGVVAATLSSAMASFLGAPRIIQSMANDRIFPILNPLAKGYGPANNPRRATLLSLTIAYGTVALGDLNVIAPVVTMFFLVSYGLLNYATFYEARAKSPSFRPRFKYYNLRLSLLGALGCLVAMVAIDVTPALIACAILFALYEYIKQKDTPSRWADSQRSYHLQLIRDYLIEAAGEPQHPRDWRPQILAFSDDPKRRNRLLKFSSWIEGGSGITTVVRIKEGSGLRMIREKEKAEEELQAFLREHNLKAFPLVLVTPDVRNAIHILIQSYGVGPLRANTVVLNWLDELAGGILPIREREFGLYLRTAFRLGCNIVILDSKEDEWVTLESHQSGDCRIDVWWTGDSTSRLMLLFAYLMKRSSSWEDATIRMLAIGKPETLKHNGATVQNYTETVSGEPHGTEQVVLLLKHMLSDIRIQASIEVVERADSQTVAAMSNDAAMVFLPLKLRQNQIFDPFGGRLEDLLGRLPIVALVLAAEDIDLEAGPEEGIHAEMAEAMDALEKAKKRVRSVSKNAYEISRESEKLGFALQRLKESRATPEEIEKAENDLMLAQEKASEAKKRASKAQAKLDDALKSIQDITGTSSLQSDGDKKAKDDPD
ncbi:MAG TPA: amino acid permease [Deltaproteobacteria bacterium]|nr:amino acid permease [Deltaproteobacteria bacterium]